MGIRVLGPVTVDEGPELSRRDRIVLSALVLQRPRPVSRDRLEALLWPDGAPPTSTKVIQGCVARLRARLDGRWITTTDHGYRLEQTGDLDLTTFEHGIHRGRELLRLDQPDRAAHVLTEALALWHGVPFEDLELWDLAAVESARLEELRRQAEELRVDALLVAGATDEAAAAATLLVDAQPLREHRWHQLAVAQVRSDRQADALSSLRRCRALLVDELGLEPGTALLELETAILRGDPSLLQVERPTGDGGSCPWPGLQSYDESGAESFFGREAETVSALAILRGRGVLVVVGPSGVGKSSLVVAGVSPALAGEGRQVSTMTPGLAPTVPGCADVLVVDQCEEVFGSGIDADCRTEFFAALVDHARACPLVVCLRADRMADVAAHPDLARLVERGLFLLRPMDAAGLRAAIEQPAARAGLLVEPGLVDVLLRDVEDEPGALPLLSHALVGTWERREGRTLTVAGYQASGGVRGAVAQTAENLFIDLTGDQRANLRGLMLRLVSNTPEGQPMRARVSRQVVAPDVGRRALVEQMVGSRLLTTDEGMVTLAHEALVRAWPRLRRWIDEDEDGRRILQHLASSALSWDALGRPDSELYRGIRLARARGWQRDARVDLTVVETAFLRTSQARADDEERSMREQVRREQRANRRLRGLAAVLAATVVLALGAGILALHQSRAADRAALAADARRLGSAALTEPDPQRSLMTALAAARLDPSVETDNSLQAVLAEHPQLVRATTLPVTSTLSQVLSTPQALLVVDRTHTVHRLEPRSLEPVQTAQAGGKEGDVWDVPLALSAQQHILAVASQQPDRYPVRLLDPRTLRLLPDQLQGWPRRHVGVMSLATSGDGRFLAAGMATSHIEGPTDGTTDSGRVMVWDLRTKQAVLTIHLSAYFFVGVALDHTGRRVFVTNPVTAYDVSTGRRLWRRGPADYRLPADLQPHGRLLAVMSPDASTRVELRDPATGRLVHLLDGHERDVTAIEFSHDGRLVAASGNDGLALVWDVTSGEIVDRIDVGGDQVIGLAFSQSDRTLHTIAEPGHQVSTWDLTGRRTFITRVRVRHPSVIGSGNARISHDGTRVATLSQSPSGPELRVVDPGLDRNVRIQTPRHLGSFGAMAWSPDDRRLAMGFDDGVVQVADGRSGRAVGRHTVLQGMVAEVGYSTDGRFLMAADVSGNVVRLDPATLRPTGTEVRLPENPYAVASSPDGRYAFLIAGGTKWLPYWDVPIDHYYLADLDSGRIVSTGPAGVHNAVYADYSPDGEHVTVAGRNGEVVVLEMPSGRPVQTRVDVYSGDSFSVRYDPSGDLVTTASTTGQAALLDGRTGDLLATAALPSVEGVTVSGFAPDGGIILATFRGHVFRWDPSAEHAISFACSVTGRGLTRGEWAAQAPRQPWRDTCAG